MSNFLARDSNGARTASDARPIRLTPKADHPFSAPGRTISPAAPQPIKAPLDAFEATIDRILVYREFIKIIISASNGTSVFRTENEDHDAPTVN